MQRMKSFIRRLYFEIASRRAYKFLIKDWTAFVDLDACAAVLSTHRFTKNLQPMVLAKPKGRRIFVIAPHPDDEMIGPGGTLIRAIRQGAEVQVLYLANASGEEGHKRHAETLEIAKQVGYATSFLGCDSGKLQPNEVVVEAVSAALRDFTPDTVFIPFFCDDHEEHRMASEILLRAHERGLLSAHPEIWAYQVYTTLLPNVVVDITTEHEEKAARIAMWQTSAMKSRDWAHFALGLNAFNSRLLQKPEGRRYVEAFFVLPMREYLDASHHYFASVNAKTIPNPNT